MSLYVKKFIISCLALLWLPAVFNVDTACAAEKKSPVTQYWMSVATQNMVMPGMPKSLPGMGSMFGKMGGPQRSLLLQLNSPRTLPPAPEATHDIPPGQLMGRTLPLLIPERERVRGEEYEYHEERPEKFEKPKMRMLIYWGCSETVRPDQPRVIDTEKMNPADFGKAFAGKSVSAQYPPSPRAGWIFADWPNRKSSIQVPEGSSLKGDHLVHGNYSPDISFFIGERHDFMAPVEFTSVQGDLSESIRFEWRSIPTAIGYFATAMASNQKTGEMIFWSSSEVQETGFSLMDYLPNNDIRRLIKEKVVMTPETTNCAIPQGIFKDTGGGMLQFIGYGDEMNIAYPPKPKYSNKPHEYIWSLKVRLKSTGMLPLSSGMMSEESRYQERKRAGRETLDKEEPGQEVEEPASAPEPKTEEVPKEAIKGTINKLRGIFGF